MFHVTRVIATLAILAALTAPSLAQPGVPATPQASPWTKAELAQIDFFGLTKPANMDTASVNPIRRELAKKLANMYVAFVPTKVMLVGGKTHRAIQDSLAELRKDTDANTAAILAYDAALMQLVPDTIATALSTALPGQPSYGDALASQGKLTSVLRTAGLSNVASKSGVEKKLDEILAKLQK